MFELRPLSPSAIPSALAKAERYRLLNEGGQAESICLDVLAVDPDNQEALAMMILSTSQAPRTMDPLPTSTSCDKRSLAYRSTTPTAPMRYPEQPRTAVSSKSRSTISRRP